jgi:hypothetical protein
MTPFYNEDVMRSRRPRSRRPALTAALAPLILMVVLVTAVSADHPGSFRAGPLSPMLTALLSGGLALLLGLAIVVIIMLLTRKDSASE